MPHIVRAERLGEGTILLKTNEICGSPKILGPNIGSQDVLIATFERGELWQRGGGVG